MEKIEGMLIGSVIGDAAGGPVEFVHPPQRGLWTTGRHKITTEGIEQLAASFRLRDYLKHAEPFAQWESFGPAGTITDDTRFKMVFFNTLRYHDELNRLTFAHEVMHFKNRLPDRYKPWFDRWIPEIGYAARWVLGERENAYPPERIWGGIPTMAGQMPFLPVAALYPGDPEAAYLKTWELDFIDVGIGRDINASLVAGLARALERDGSWQNLEKAMRETDPYNYNNVLYVPRRLNEWLDVAHVLVEKADGSIGRLFDLLETSLQAKTWWEAWVPLVVVFSCAEIVHYDPLATMQLMIEFGHDTDSYAQVMGAIMGAIHGKRIFPNAMRRQVDSVMRIQFGENTRDWIESIEHYRQQTDKVNQ